MYERMMGKLKEQSILNWVGGIERMGEGNIHRRGE